MYFSKLLSHAKHTLAILLLVCGLAPNCLTDAKRQNTDARSLSILSEVDVTMVQPCHMGYHVKCD